jgi:hypothetical protein
MRLADGAYINNIARLEKTEEIEKESAEVDKEIENTPVPEVKKDEAEFAETYSEEESSDE